MIRLAVCLTAILRQVEYIVLCRTASVNLLVISYIISDKIRHKFQDIVRSLFTHTASYTLSL